jgi:hypothetical protein
MSKSLLLKDISLKECKCLSGFNTKFRLDSSYILQAILHCKAGTNLTRVLTIENSVRLEQSGYLLTAKSLELAVDTGVYSGSLLLRLLECDVNGKGRVIGELVYLGLSDTLTQVTNRNVTYSWLSSRSRVCDLTLGSCVASGFVLDQHLISAVGDALRATIDHSYSRCFRICQRSAALSTSMVLFESLYRFTVPEIDGIPFCAIGHYLSCPENDSIPPSYIDNLQRFAEKITVVHSQKTTASQWHRDWEVVCNMLRVDANLTTYGSDRTAIGQTSEQWQTTRSVVQALVSAGMTDNEVVADCEDDAISIITLARRVSSLGNHKTAAIMEFLPVICAVRGDKFEVMQLLLNDKSVALCGSL